MSKRPTPTSVPPLPPVDAPCKRKRMDDAIKDYNCMNCGKLFEYEGELHEHIRLPMAPCKGCGYQVCLVCVREQQVQDASHRRNHTMSQWVNCPSQCGETKSFNAEKPVINELACNLIQKNEQLQNEKEEVEQQMEELRQELEGYKKNKENNHPTQTPAKVKLENN